MAAWHERVPLLAAVALMAHAATGSAAGAGPATVSAAQSDNAVVPVRSGRVQPAAGAAEVELKFMYAAVRADAANRLGVPLAAIQLSIQEMVWPDGALGCAQPGQTATQALESGWRIVARLASRQTSMTYHASRRGEWRQCSGVVVEPGGPSER